MHKEIFTSKFEWQSKAQHFLVGALKSGLNSGLVQFRGKYFLVYYLLITERHENGYEAKHLFILIFKINLFHGFKKKLFTILGRTSIAQRNHVFFQL